MKYPLNGFVNRLARCCQPVLFVLAAASASVAAADGGAAAAAGDEDLPRRFAAEHRGALEFRLPDIEADVALDIYYHKPKTDGEPARVVVYVMNDGYPRIGMEPDRDILADLIGEGYIVITADFKNHPLAVSPRFDHDLNLLAKAIYGRGQPSFLKRIGLEPYEFGCYFIPAGYRIARNVEFWNIREHGAPGTLEHIVDTYNRFIVPKHGKEPVREAGQMLTKAGEPLDARVYQMYMDIVYPSMPAHTVPLICSFASDHKRNPIGHPNQMRMHMAGFALRGYAVAFIDHCFNPLTHEYGYFGSFTLDPLNGLAANTAAVRFLRLHSAQYGIDPERIGAWGHSKAAYAVTRLSDPKHEGGREHQVAKAGSVSQPWQGVSSRISAGYQSMGFGTMRHEYVTADYVPTIIAVGENDPYGCWEDWPGLTATYEREGVRHLALAMLGMGHTLPAGYDDKLNLDRYEACHRFFDSYLKNAEHPQVIYVARQGGELVALFAPQMDAQTLAEGATVLTADGRPVAGEWRPALQDTRFHFSPQGQALPEQELLVRFAGSVADRQGRTFKTAREYRR